MKIQLTISQMEEIINAARKAQQLDISLSSTVEIEAIKKIDTHLGGDKVGVILKSGYAECYGTAIYFNSNSGTTQIN
jgi:hypothetical protein